MRCPLCHNIFERGEPVLYTMWQEMETEEVERVGVHLWCAWHAVRNELYRREEVDHWDGWEPVVRNPLTDRILPIISDSKFFDTK